MITVNAMGDACPIPVIKTKKALQELSGSGEVEVLVDNETAVRNVTKMAESSGASVTQEKLGEGQYRVLLKVGGGSEAGAETTGGDSCGCDGWSGVYGDTIVVVSSDRMGEGNDELGHVLMKSFIFAVTQLDELPEENDLLQCWREADGGGLPCTGGPEEPGGTGCGDHDLRDLSGLLRTQRQACSRDSDEHVQYCGDNAEGGKDHPPVG